MLVILIVILPMMLVIGILLHCLDRKVQREKEKAEILAVQRREERIERERVRRVKRLARQKGIGDRLYWSLADKALSDRKIWRIRENFGSEQEGNYCIGIGGDITIYVDLRLTGREISLILPCHLGGGKEFSLADGEGWIKNKLVEQVFGK